MSKILYEKKIGIQPYTIRKNQCQDLDMNEIKTVVNDNDTCSAETLFPVQLDKTSAGRRYGSWGMPMQGVISVTQSGIQEGGCAVIVWSGSTTPAVTGVVIQQYVGVITEQGVYSIYIHFLNGRVNVNIFGQAGEGPVPILPDAPTNLAVGTVTNTTIPLTWTKSATGVMTEYRVYINYNLQQTFSGDVASGTLTGLASGTAYNLISVRAFDGTYESTDSNFVNATTTGGTTPSATAPTITVTETGSPSATTPTITVTEVATPSATAPTITVTE